FYHEINTHGGHGTEMPVNGYFEPTENTDIEFFLIKNNTITKQVASCQAGTKYTVILKRTGATIDVIFKSLVEKTIRVAYFVDKRTKSQEIDQELLETEAKELEIAEMATENLERMMKEAENLGQGLGSGLEKEKFEVEI